MSIESGWVFDPVPKHYCITPTNADLQGHFEGALWKCGDCGLFWELFWDSQERKKDMRPVAPMIAEARMAEAQ